MNWTQQNLQNFNKTKGLKSLNPGHATAEVLATNSSTKDKTGTKWMPNGGKPARDKLNQTIFNDI